MARFIDQSARIKTKEFLTVFSFKEDIFIDLGGNGILLKSTFKIKDIPRFKTALTEDFCFIEDLIGDHILFTFFFHHA
jgi:hypothetical protein